MAEVNINYLRSLYNLGVDETVSSETKDIQEKTIIAIYNVLSEKPGVILGDDVGMGKTFMAIGTALLLLQKKVTQPIVIVTPGWELNYKWQTDIRKFIEMNCLTPFISEDEVGFVEKSNTLIQIKQFIELSSCKMKKIIVTPSNIFNSGSYKKERAFFANCWFRHKGFREDTRNKYIKLLRLSDNEVFNPLEEKDMWINYREVNNSVFHPLDNLYSKERITQENAGLFLECLNQVRYNAINSLLPQFSLFILDEAHKIKNVDTVSHQALVEVLKNKYDKTLFLTATPFQLEPRELFSIISLFLNGSINEEEKSSYAGDIESFRNLLIEYQNRISTFETSWNYLSPLEALECEKSINSQQDDISKMSIDSKITMERYYELVEAKNRLQTEMRKFMIRNVKDKSGYRKEIIGSLVDENKESIELLDEHFIPFALWEKVLYNIYLKKGSTFISAVQQSLTSSYEAIKESSLFKVEGDNHDKTIETLGKIIGKQKTHPKMKELLENVNEAIKNGEKTLVFVERVHTAKTLQDKINEMAASESQKRVMRALGENEKNIDELFKNYKKRFYSKNDGAWFYLQENYLYTILPFFTGRTKPGVRASEITQEVSELYQKYNNSKRPNYMYLKRIVEHIVFKRIIRNINYDSKMDRVNSNLNKSVQNILNPEYIKYGLNLKADDYEVASDDSEETDFKRISVTLIKNILDSPGIWVDYKEELSKLSPEHRDNVVEALIGFIRRDDSFFVDLKIMDTKKDIELSDAVVKAFRQGKSFKWQQATKRFLNYYIKASTAEKENMITGLKESDVAASITGETKNKSKIIEGFNTPFYPMVILAMPSSQEGLDMQKECRRIIHYDLNWNPASLEQRVGRIDRINSLTSRMRKTGEDVKLQVFSPFIKNTIDEHIFETVKSREKWFSFILGGTPDWDSFSIDEQVRPLPSSLCKRLQVDLSVK